MQIFWKLLKEIGTSKGLRSYKYKILMNFNSVFFKLIQQGMLSCVIPIDIPSEHTLDIVDWN